jgi:hypothetical protein
MKWCYRLFSVKLDLYPGLKNGQNVPELTIIAEVLNSGYTLELSATLKRLPKLKFNPNLIK